MEFDRKRYEIKTALRRRELHRMRLKENLVMIEHNKEKHLDQFLSKIRVLKRELFEEKLKSKTKVEGLFSRINSLHEELEATERQTNRFLAYKKQYELEKSITKMLNKSETNLQFYKRNQEDLVQPAENAGYEPYASEYKMDSILKATSKYDLSDNGLNSSQTIIDTANIRKSQTLMDDQQKPEQFKNYLSNPTPNYTSEPFISSSKGINPEILSQTPSKSTDKISEPSDDHSSQYFMRDVTKPIQTPNNYLMQEQIKITNDSISSEEDLPLDAASEPNFNEAQIESKRIIHKKPNFTNGAIRTSFEKEDNSLEPTTNKLEFKKKLSEESETLHSIDTQKSTPKLSSPDKSIEKQNSTPRFSSSSGNSINKEVTLKPTEDKTNAKLPSKLIDENPVKKVTESIKIPESVDTSAKKQVPPRQHSVEKLPGAISKVPDKPDKSVLPKVTRKPEIVESDSDAEFFDEKIQPSVVSSAAYQRMLGINPVAKVDISEPQYDTESIDSVEAAIQASVTAKKSPMDKLNPKDDSDDVSNTDEESLEEDLAKKSQPKASLVKAELEAPKPSRKISALSIKLDSDSESSAVSVGVAPDIDDDDDFYM